jgi:DNA-directed RNA polymerase subunit RPC12/RpoP
MRWGIPAEQNPTLPAGGFLKLDQLENLRLATTHDLYKNRVMATELCPLCGEPLVGDAAISKTPIEVMLTCPCGYRALAKPDPEMLRQMELVRECSAAGALEAIAH